MDYVQVLEHELQELAAGAVALLPNLAIAVIVLAITAIVARGVAGAATRIARRTHVRNDLQELFRTLAKLGIWIIGTLLTLTILIPGFTFGGMVAGLGIGAVAIGFAFQDIFENFLAGVLIMLRDKMHIGDSVEAEGVDGTVEKITLRETHIRQFSGELTILPNSMIFKNAVKVVSDQPHRRFDLMVGVSYDSDLAAVRHAIEQGASSVPGIVADRGVEVYAREFGASSIDFLVRWWVDTRSDSLFQVHNQMVFAIKKALDDAGVEIPYPHVTHTFGEAVPIEARDQAA